MVRFDGPRRILLCLTVLGLGLGAGAGAAAADTAPAAAVAPTRSGEPPADPFLRVETGMHGAIINRVSVDASGRLAATASDDKTARLWSLPDGKLLATLRVPIGPGLEGGLYSVALSPDGKTVATAGAVGQLWDGLPSLYLFDAATHKIKGRLPKLPSEILHLAFSPDGRRLAAAFGGGAGLVVYDAGTGRVLGEDRDYGRQPANWVAFDARGRMATTGFDGFVRLYDASAKLVARTRLPNAGRPFSVAFSPDGGLLAVGSFDKPRVDILSATDLAPRLVPDTGDLKTGNLAAVGWLDDGHRVSLAAGGTATKGADAIERIIRVWSEAGKGRAVDIAAAADSINQIEPIGGGEALFVSAAPSWGRIDAGRKLFERTSDLANFRDIQAGRLALSDDGLTLEFGTAWKGRKPMRLALATQSYGPVKRPDPALATPITEVTGLQPPGLKPPGLKPIEWRNTPTPAIGARKLALDGEERARALAITPDGRGFLLGADYSVRLYDAAGNQRAKTDVAAAVAGLVINRPGTLAVAALTDGTLHWYSLGPGAALLEERATVFAHPDGQRWVAWTPEGFFDHATTGGIDMVGYHLNKGKGGTPDWVTFDQLYAVFHRADLLKMKILGGLDREIARTVAAIGDPRSRLESQPPPGIEVTDYCWSQGAEAETCRPIAEITTRGFARDTARQAGPAGAAPAPAAAAPALNATLPAGAAGLKLRFQVVDRGGGVGDVAVYLNGRNVDRQTVSRAFHRDPHAAAGVLPPEPAPSGRFERLVALEPGGNVIEIRAYDQAGGAFTASRRVEVVRPEPPPEAGRDGAATAPRKPNLYILAVGINAYKSPGNRLRYAVADAEGFARALARNTGELFQTVFAATVTPAGAVAVAPAGGGAIAITDADATRPTVLKAFAAIAADPGLGMNDVVAIYLSGHGEIDDRPDAEGETGGGGKARPRQYYFITQEVEAATLKDQAFGQDMIVQRLIPILGKTKKVFLVLDTCHAASAAGESMLSAIDNIGHDAGVSLLSAAAASEEALDGYRTPGKPAEHGVFAHAVLTGLAGQAIDPDDDSRGMVRISQYDVGEYVRRRVVELAKEVDPSHQQHASFRNLGEAQKIPLVKVER